MNSACPASDDLTQQQPPCACCPPRTTPPQQHRTLLPSSNNKCTDAGKACLLVSAARVLVISSQQQDSSIHKHPELPMTCQAPMLLLVQWPSSDAALRPRPWAEGRARLAQKIKRFQYPPSQAKHAHAWHCPSCRNRGKLRGLPRCLLNSAPTRPYRPY